MANENSSSVQFNGLSVVSGRIPENNSLYCNGDNNTINGEQTMLSGLRHPSKKVLGSQEDELFDVELESYPSKSEKSGDIYEENGIGKGVVLNARLFPSKQSALSNNLARELNSKVSQTKNKEWSSPNKVKPMNLARKIVFVLSFLPSILFVVGFAVIFPCRENDLGETCTTEAWTLFFNNTVLVTDLFGISDSLVVGISSNEKDQVISIDKQSGETIWARYMDSRLNFLDCKDFDVNGDGISECLITENSSIIHVLNASNGGELAHINMNNAVLLRPVILPGCEDNNTRIVAIATSSSTIQIMRGDLTRITTLTLKGCQSIPRNLLAWHHHSQTDLVFVCKSTQGIDEIRLLKNSDWCQKQQKTSISSQNLTSFSDEENIKNTLFLPCPEGLVVWMEKTLIYFDGDGNKQWRLDTSRYDERFLVYGNYSHRRQIAAIGVIENNGSQITLLNIEDGLNATVHNIPKYEVKMIGTITGRKQDYIILLLEGFIDNRMFMDITAHFEITNSPSHSNKTFIFHSIKSSPLHHMVRQRIVLLNLEGDEESRESISEQEILAYTYDMYRRSDNDAAKLSAYTIDEGILNILIGKTVLQLEDNILTIRRQQNNTYIRSVNTKSWDKSFSPCKYS